MEKQEKLILISTCVVGFCAGFYLYLTGFMPQFLSPGGNTAAEYETFTIVGEQYGGCDMTSQCAAFQLLANGSFSFVRGTEGPVTGNLTRSEQRAVQATLTPSNLAAASQPATDDDCLSDRGGIDYRYQVILDNREYTLDTCTTKLLDDSEMVLALDKLWNYFATAN